MEHATALVDHDATTPKICGCQRLVDAGWAVRCAACGRVTTATNPAVASPLLEIQYRLPETPGGHTCTGCVACYDDMAADADADEADAEFEAQREAELADEVARRVA